MSCIQVRTNFFHGKISCRQHLLFFCRSFGFPIRIFALFLEIDCIQCVQFFFCGKARIGKTAPDKLLGIDMVNRGAQALFVWTVIAVIADIALFV